MEEMSLEKSVELLRKAGQKKGMESVDQTKSRFKGALQKREDAIRRLHEYQTESGMPTKEEVDREFYEANGISFEEVKTKLIED